MSPGFAVALRHLQPLLGKRHPLLQNDHDPRRQRPGNLFVAIVGDLHVELGQRQVRAGVADLGRLFLARILRGRILLPSRLLHGIFLEGRCIGSRGPPGQEHCE